MGHRKKNSRNRPGVLGLPAMLALGLLLVISAVEAQEVNPTYKGMELTDFGNFMKEFNRNYSGAELIKRKEIFEENTKTITDHNELFKSGDETYFLRVNDFTDITDEEFADKYFGGGYFFDHRPEPTCEPVKEYKQKEIKVNIHINRNKQKRSSGVEPKTYIDWMKDGGVREVGDQQLCASCAAHAAITLVEYCMWKFNGELPEPLSAHQFSACTPGHILGSYPLRHGNIHCKSGFPDVHLDYMRQLWADSNGTKNIQLAKDGVSADNPDCPNEDSNEDAVNVKVTGANYEIFTTESDMFKALYAGPLTTRLEFGIGPRYPKGIKSYGGGIFWAESECPSYATEKVPKDCQKQGKPGTYDCAIFRCLRDMPLHCNRFLNGKPPRNIGLHSVVVVGAGRDERNEHFWKIKNSWGKGWGENGMLRLKRGLGHCGVGSSFTQVECDVI